MTAEEKKWLSTEEAAEYIGMSPNTLNNWRAFGHGPRYSKLADGLRGAVRYNKAAIDEWMASREKEVSA